MNPSEPTVFAAPVASAANNGCYFIEKIVGLIQISLSS